MSLEIEVLDDPPRACAAMLVGAAVGAGHVVLTGGGTAGTAYEEFAKVVRTVGLDLGRTTLWFGDERCVPPDDELSNYRLAKETLLDPLADVTQPVVRRMQGELGPAEGADAYARELDENGPPQFDMVMLGLGPDAHIASLFPDQDTLNERSRTVVGVPEAGHEPYVPRISLTLPTLVRCKQIVFLVVGESKADAVGAAFGVGARPDHHAPASLIAPMANEVTVLLDRAAAERL